MNWKFKTKLVEQYGSQLLASAKLGISPSELSLLVRGHRKPNDRQMKALLANSSGEIAVDDIGS